jgi:hypothetical protein
MRCEWFEYVCSACGVKPFDARDHAKCDACRSALSEDACAICGVYVCCGSRSCRAAFESASPAHPCIAYGETAAALSAVALEAMSESGRANAAAARLSETLSSPSTNYPFSPTAAIVVDDAASVAISAARSKISRLLASKLEAIRRFAGPAFVVPSLFALAAEVSSESHPHTYRAVKSEPDAMDAAERDTDDDRELRDAVADLLSRHPAERGRAWAVSMACRRGCPRVLSELAASKSSSSVECLTFDPSDGSCYELRVACERGHVSIVKALFGEKGVASGARRVSRSREWLAFNEVFSGGPAGARPFALACGCRKKEAWGLADWIAAKLSDAGAARGGGDWASDACAALARADDCAAMVAACSAGNVQAMLALSRPPFGLGPAELDPMAGRLVVAAVASGNPAAVAMLASEPLSLVGKASPDSLGTALSVASGATAPESVRCGAGRDDRGGDARCEGEADSEVGGAMLGALTISDAARFPRGAVQSCFYSACCGCRPVAAARLSRHPFRAEVSEDAFFALLASGARAPALRAREARASIADVLESWMAEGGGCGGGDDSGNVSLWRGKRESARAMEAAYARALRIACEAGNDVLVARPRRLEAMFSARLTGSPVRASPFWSRPDPADALVPACAAGWREVVEALGQSAEIGGYGLCKRDAEASNALALRAACASGTAEVVSVLSNAPYSLGIAAADACSALSIAVHRAVKACSPVGAEALRRSAAAAAATTAAAASTSTTDIIALPPPQTPSPCYDSSRVDRRGTSASSSAAAVADSEVFEAVRIIEALSSPKMAAVRTVDAIALLADACLCPDVRLLQALHSSCGATREAVAAVNPSVLDSAFLSAAASGGRGVFEALMCLYGMTPTNHVSPDLVETAVCRAVDAGNLDSLKFLFCAYGADPRARGNYALQRACLGDCGPVSSATMLMALSATFGLGARDAAAPISQTLLDDSSAAASLFSYADDQLSIARRGNAAFVIAMMADNGEAISVLVADGAFGTGAAAAMLSDALVSRVIDRQRSHGISKRALDALERAVSRSSSSSGDEQRRRHQQQQHATGDPAVGSAEGSAGPGDSCADPTAAVASERRLSVVAPPDSVSSSPVARRAVPQKLFFKDAVTDSLLGRSSTAPMSPRRFSLPQERSTDDAKASFSSFFGRRPASSVGGTARKQAPSSSPSSPSASRMRGGSAEVASRAVGRGPECGSDGGGDASRGNTRRRSLIDKLFGH